MKFYIILFSFFTVGIYTAKAQINTAPQVELGTGKDSTYYAQYNKLKQLYIARIHSPSYIKLREAIQNYKKKWRHLYKENVGNLYNDSGAIKWLEKNWQKTEFKSYEEAVAEWENILNLLKIDNQKNQEFQNQSVWLVFKYGPSAFANLEMEMRREFPDKI